MSRWWTVQVQRVTVSDGWRRSEGLPTFFLDADFHGITSAAHAERIARKVVGDDLKQHTFYVSVAPAEDSS